MKILLILFHLPTENSSMQSVNSIIRKLPPMHLPSIKKKGTLQLLNSQQTGGEDPCYIIASGNNVITANYSGGSISVFPIAKRWLAPTHFRYYTIQRYGVDKERQEKPHLHCVRITPDGKYLFANDLCTDQIHKFIINLSCKCRE